MHSWYMLGRMNKLKVFSTLRRRDLPWHIHNIIFKSNITENAQRVICWVPIVLVKGILVESPPAREARDCRVRRPMVLIIRGVQIENRKKWQLKKKYLFTGESILESPSTSFTVRVSCRSTIMSFQRERRMETSMAHRTIIGRRMLGGHMLP